MYVITTGIIHLLCFRHSFVVHCDMDLKSFPFDDQICEIIIESCESIAQGFFVLFCFVLNYCSKALNPYNGGYLSLFWLHMYSLDIHIFLTFGGHHKC